MSDTSRSQVCAEPWPAAHRSCFHEDVWSSCAIGGHGQSRAWSGSALTMQGWWLMAVWRLSLACARSTWPSRLPSMYSNSLLLLPVSGLTHALLCCMPCCVPCCRSQRSWLLARQIPATLRLWTRLWRPSPEWCGWVFVCLGGVAPCGCDASYAGFFFTGGGWTSCPQS